MIEIPDGNLRSLLAQFGIAEVAARSTLATISANDALRRGLTIALDRTSRRGLDKAMTDRVESSLQRLAREEVSDETRAVAAEVEAGLRLAWIDAVVRPMPGKRPTCDFRVGPLIVEVYCPQQHVEERRVVQADLAAQAKAATTPISVAIAIGHPATGSGRKVDGEGLVVRDAASQAASFPANKLIDRLLSRKKREATQFVVGEQNILWLDLKYGLEFLAIDCMPIRSCVSKGTCFVGTNGVWHAFYGRRGDPLFAERTVLEYPVPRATYPQQREGWFREVPQASCAIVSVLDGVVRLDNPWASTPVAPAISEVLMGHSELRPEFSWFDEQTATLMSRVESERRRIEWVARGAAAGRTS